MRLARFFHYSNEFDLNNGCCFSDRFDLSNGLNCLREHTIRLLAFRVSTCKIYHNRTNIINNSPHC
jgi:hypothetical protein